jgi:hypothetical protein
VKLESRCPRCSEPQFQKLKAGEVCHACQNETSGTWRSGCLRRGTTMGNALKGPTRLGR